MRYRSEFYVYDQEKPVPVVIRNYNKNDFDELIQIQSECFPPPFPAELWWNKDQLNNHITLFPEGALCVEVNGELAGSLTGLCVDFDPDHPVHTWEEVTDNGYIRSHNPQGSTLYIVDISVRPKYRKLGLGKLMMQAMYHVVIELGLERLLGGGRMPGFKQKSAEMSAEQYIEAVTAGDIKDPVISFLLRCGRVPVAVVEQYLDDEESCNYGTLMEWKNPFK
ncbi:GNAT family N-acetyltransferase [Bacillus canaveralius]|uniref:GNAT family N-acetyltransferase n=1 Tax=Bacillus canaveralius TaxID=1403243 RepID=A0A2N5GIR7_9BACI|nr:MULTISPECIES: GNAT family N-acetyltransferase [Bacillus]PLR80909.1 GNAT family N-acetyltransferase [Bacillus canaveralius]PLR83365.1 GNAT family N-acetyltransferase [Bacillus sp. V33-4]PLR91197.1 GNAT family N-acetyltransferase [Bacillus canaveralius]RSK52659.1 GNAT family N-acetyltransferase [Bacillus canaveralius]